MAFEAGTKALHDASISFEDIEHAVVGYVYGDSTCGQKAVYKLGLTGIPIYNVNNNCSTGSTALMLGKQLIEGGLADCVLALGFEKMASGSLSSHFNDRANPLENHVNSMAEMRGIEASPITVQMFGNAGREHMEKYGTTKHHFAKVAWKNHKHSVNNPYSQFQEPYTYEEILSSKEIHFPLTKLQCCPTSDGSAAVVLASEKFVRKHNLMPQAVKILGMEMSTDQSSTFNTDSINLVGFQLTKTAAERLYQKTGINPQDIDVIELHDCFSANELITYEALGLCEIGKAGEFIDNGDNTFGGKFVVNPSGGLISKGHPLGATGLAQCCELCWQLRGLAQKRQVPHAKLALQQNIGLGGASVVAAYKLGFPSEPQRQSTLNMSNVSSPTEQDFKSYPVFQLIKQQLKTDGDAMVKKTQGIYCIEITSGPGNTTGKWIVDLKSGTGEIVYGVDKKADCTIKISDENFPLLMTGKLNPQQAFMSGKLKVSGKVALAMKLGNLKLKNTVSKL
ncbi:non-specific lipid-transfer protein isoform X2 [Octopus sinensis]|nr:non-specific lipid-transfer protein isoform X2 [Octopus sinensis]